MSYLVLKWAHLIGAALLFGTGLGIAFFAWFGYRMGMRERNLGLVQGVLRLTVIADAAFTAMAAAIQPLTGAALWSLGGRPWTHPWLLWVLAVYGFVGICWLPVVALQVRLRDRALAVNDVADLGPGFHRTFRVWFVLGWPAFAGVMVLYALMLGRGWFG